jgi:hypothetical protein
MSLSDLFDYVEHHQEPYLETLFTFIRQPSINTQNIGVRECASLLVEMVKDAGMDAQKRPTRKLKEWPGHPQPL